MEQNNDDMKDNDKEDNVYLMEDWTRTTEDGVEAASPASRRSPGGRHWVPCDVESGEGQEWVRNQGRGELEGQEDQGQKLGVREWLG